MSERRLKTVVTALPLANQKVIDVLREALKDAKAGKIQGVGIAVACVDDGPNADNGRATETIISFADGWAHTTGVAIHGLAFRLNHERYTQGHPLPPGKLDENDE